MIRKAFFWLLLGLTVALWSYSDTLFPPDRISAASANVRDGDTLIVGGRALRLEGIDAPEYRQTCNDAKGAAWDCGKAARQRLEELSGGGRLECEHRDSDSYGRPLAKCATATVPDLGEAMVGSGLAVGNGRYLKTEASARAAKRGIWQGTFEAPAAWRAAHPREDKP